MERQAFIKGPGGRLWYSVFGEDQPGTPLLFIHGGPGFLSVMDELRELADTRPVYFYDQLGCGRSERSHDAAMYELDDYVEELAAVRDALCPRDVVLVGHSWGTALAVEYVVRYRPEGVKGLVLSGPLISAPLWERDQREHLSKLPEAVRAVVDKAEKRGVYDEAYMGAMMVYYRRHLCRLDPWPACLAKAFGEMNLDIYRRLWGESEFTITGTLKNLDLTPFLSGISVPTLYIAGEHDEAGIETVKRCRDLTPKGELAILPNASHCHYLEQPELFRAVVREFLSRALS